MVLQVLFWILLVLCALGVFAPDSPQPSPYIVRGRSVIMLLLIGILGYYVFNGVK